MLLMNLPFTGCLGLQQSPASLAIFVRRGKKTSGVHPLKRQENGLRWGRRGTKQMRGFCCDRCGSLVFFENYQCLKCDSRLGFAPDVLDLLTVDKEGEAWRAVAG